jgi:hypothetical protein
MRHFGDGFVPTLDGRCHPTEPFGRDQACLQGSIGLLLFGVYILG